MDRVEQVARALCGVAGENADETYQTGEVDAVVTDKMVATGYVRAAKWKK